MSFKTTFAAIILLSLCACQDDDGGLIREYFDGRSAYQEWKDLRAEKGDSYTYIVEIEEMLSINVTEIEVRDGVVVYRKYEKYSLSATGKGDVQLTYEETGDQVGGNEAGMPPYTMDELYSSCLFKYLRPADYKYNYFFTAGIESTPSLCGFIPSACISMGDCMEEFRVTSFTWN